MEDYYRIKDAEEEEKQIIVIEQNYWESCQCTEALATLFNLY